MKILFRIPFTEYFLAYDIRLCLARKVWYGEYPTHQITNISGNYGFIKV
jgi:hypothetical protein